MHKQALTYIVRVIAQRALGLLLYLLGASWAMSFRSKVYFALYFVSAIISSAVMYRANPTTLAERSKVDTNSPKWDKALLGIYWLLAFFFIYLVAGIESAKAPPAGVAFWTGVILQLLSVAVVLWSMMVNTFLESTARVQTDRAQTVCKNGPYRIIRHPTYSSILLWCVSVSMVFATPIVMAVAAVVALIITIRTYLEDEMLKEQLVGYAEYSREVPYRLVPFVW
ncbi:MAG: isoprenylcysteine carboxylmethyltransferase family protein [Bacillota bacterium]